MVDEVVGDGMAFVGLEHLSVLNKERETDLGDDLVAEFRPDSGELRRDALKGRLAVDGIANSHSAAHRVGQGLLIMSR